MLSNSAAGEEVPPYKKRKMSNSDSPMSSMLPDDMVLSCVARMSRSDHASLSLVSKRHRSLVASPELYRMRSLLGCAENCQYVCLLTPIPRWFILSRGKSVNRRLLSPIPSPPPCGTLEASSVVVLDWGIYVIGGLRNGKSTSDVWVLDCRTHTWRSLPPMKLPRANAAAGVVDGKIYVLGGFLFFCHSKWGEVFDPKTQTWECLPREEDAVYIHDSVVRDDKVYAVDGKESVFYYSPREGKWGRGNRGERIGARHWCMVDNVLYCISAKGALLWYEPEELDRRDTERVMCSKEVNGLGSLKKSLSRSRLVHLDEQSSALWDSAKIRLGKTKKLVDLLPGARLTNSGRNLLLFWDVVEGDRLEIWCAEISLQRRPQEGEIWGSVEWSNAVMTLDPFVDHYKVMYTASVTL
ncbi:unnamed protein product [Microthlaspi erraticum]|uniref:Uncharacterized protein n=1 Tax=Microthlaspi erraticum TaxID=1685480 RepID=A0A6D2J7B5_9BRAS|nr:unnamed protein product [Microthlaspi erraticum]